MEGYLAARISDLDHRLRRTNVVAHFQPNVVILTAGIADLRGLEPTNYAALNSTRDELESLIEHILTECDGCIVLVGDLPPAGKFQWPPSPRQRQITQFNAMISEIVNKQQSFDRPGEADKNKRHVLKVHFTPAGGDIYRDNGYPDNNGYLKMAYDIHERLVDAHTYGWIQEPVNQASDNGEVSPDGDQFEGASLGSSSSGFSQAVLGH